jgi:uncharacterized LabA/DUF88 family protein
LKRACIFVDGENFRYSLKDLFHNGRFTFRKNDYLPQADWHGFFTSIAEGFNCELLRTYWYVVEHVDCRPYKIPNNLADKERVLARWYAERIRACSSSNQRAEVIGAIEQELEKARRAIEGRARGWREVQSGIEHTNDQLEFRRSGSIPYDLVTCQFGVEKGVDTQLTTDMIVLSNIFDAAIILSGDADYLPPVAAIKMKGKLVYSVSFLDQKGQQLPGGARRLSNAVDSRADLDFEKVRQALNIEPLSVVTTAACLRLPYSSKLYARAPTETPLTHL